MKLFDLFSNKVKPDWIFSQEGNMWRFVFAGSNKIAGETRSPEIKKLYIFVLETATGKTFLKNFLFEGGNYWIEIEGANSSTIFLNRFEKPELPYHRNIIALDLHTGKMLWEHEEYKYFFCTEDKLYGIKQQFESTEYAEINIKNGSVVRIFPESENTHITALKKNSDDELFEESTNYPAEWIQDNNNENIKEYENLSYIINKEIENKNHQGAVEYIRIDNLLIFNYYIPNEINMKDITRMFFSNILCVYEIYRMKKLFVDVLNIKSTFNVPDNFFIRKNILYYLREKKEIAGISLDKFRI